MTIHNTAPVTENNRCFWFESALLPNGWADGVRLTIENGLFTQIESEISPPAGAQAGHVALPGMANLHSHAFQRGMSGLTEFRQNDESDSFWSWRDLLYRFVERGDPDDIESLTAMAYAEMLEGGFTRVAEFHYLHHAEGGRPYADPSEISAHIVAAAGETGIGLTLLPVFYAHSGFGGLPPQDGQRRFINTPDTFARLVAGAKNHCTLLPDAIVGIAPHSLRAVTAEELSILCCLFPDGPMHIHIAEQEQEVAASLAWSGLKPVEWLLKNVEVNERWCLVHATHITPEESENIARTNAVTGLCPVTESNLGDGIFEMPHYITSGGRFGIGTDSNVSICVADELRMLEYSQRLRFHRRNVIKDSRALSTGRVLFEMAVAGGNQATGAKAGLKCGLPADFIVLDSSQQQALQSSNDRILDEWIFRRGKSSISEVWRRGTRVVENGRHIRRSEIEPRFRKSLERTFH